MHTYLMIVKPLDILHVKGTQTSITNLQVTYFDPNLCVKTLCFPYVDMGLSRNYMSLQLSFYPNCLKFWAKSYPSYSMIY